MQMQSSAAAAPSKALLFSGSCIFFLFAQPLLFNDAILIFERLFA